MFLGMEDARWIRIPRHFCNLIKQSNFCSAIDFLKVETKRKCAKSECVSEGGGESINHFNSPTPPHTRTTTPT